MFVLVFLFVLIHINWTAFFYRSTRTMIVLVKMLTVECGLHSPQCGGLFNISDCNLPRHICLCLWLLLWSQYLCISNIIKTRAFSGLITNKCYLSTMPTENTKQNKYYFKVLQANSPPSNISRR